MLCPKPPRTRGLRLSGGAEASVPIKRRSNARLAATADALDELGRERFVRDALEPVAGNYDDVVMDTPPNLGLLTVNALVLAERVIAPVSAEDEESLHGIRELRRTVRRLAERLDRPALEIVAILTRWVPQRVSSRAIEAALVDEGLAPAVRIPARSALFARAAADRVPLAVSDPDSSPAVAYHQLAEQLMAVSAL